MCDVITLNLVNPFRVKQNGRRFVIGSDNGLAPDRLNAIIWTNDDLVFWRIYASLSLN